jgi:hypothetical protein
MAELVVIGEVEPRVAALSAGAASTAPAPAPIGKISGHNATAGVAVAITPAPMTRPDKVASRIFCTIEPPQVTLEITLAAERIYPTFGKKVCSERR